MKLTEALLAAFLAVLIFAGFLTVFRGDYQYATQTRQRAVAILLARTLADEVEAHPYGARQPQSWTREDEEPVTLVVQGLPVESRYKKKLEFLNKSFVGDGAGEKYDVVTITITWREAVGNRQHPGEENKQLVVKLPVWQ